MKKMIAALMMSVVMAGCASTGYVAPYRSVGYHTQDRSQAAIREFKASNPCPSTGRRSGACPGYDIDHRIPLAVGGADRPSNMQWLSKAAHKAKTAAERKSCAYGCKGRK